MKKIGSIEYFYIITFFLICSTSKAQKNVSHSSCDSSVKCQDIDIFNLRPIKTSKKAPVITICYSGNDITISVDERNGKRLYYVNKLEDGYLLTWVDTIYGAHKHKQLYDSILIKKNFVLQQTKHFTPEKNLLKTTIKMLSFDQDNLDGLFVSFNCPNGFSVGQYLSNERGIPYNNFNDTSVTKRKIKLEKGNAGLTFLGRSLFWHIHNFFLDFFISGVK